MPQSYEEIKKGFVLTFAQAGQPLENVKGTDLAKIADWWLSQRDADKGGERCAGCGDCLNSKATTGEECVKMRDCKCHSPKPQANVGEWEKRFTHLWENTFGKNGEYLEHDKIIDFISNLISTTSAQKLEGLERSVEGMIIKKPKCDCKTHPEHNCGITSNEAITAVLDIIRKQK